MISNMGRMGVAVLVAVFLSLSNLAVGDITIKIALVSTRKDITATLNRHTKNYLGAIFASFNLPDGIEVETEMFEVYKMTGSEWQQASEKLTPGNFIAILGSYSKDVDLRVQNETNYLPYYLVDDLFLDVKKTTPDQAQAQCITRRRGRHVVTFLPPVNYLLTPLQYYLSTNAKKSKHSVRPQAAVIVSNAESLEQFRDGLKFGKEKMLEFSAIFISRGATREQILRQLTTVRKYETRDIVLHSFDGNYIIEILIQASWLDLLTKFYRWYLTFPDTDSLNFDESNDLNLKRFGADLTGFQLVHREAFQRYNLDEPKDIDNGLIRCALLDASISLGTAVAKKVKAGGTQADLTAQVVQGYLDNGIQPSEQGGAFGKYGRFYRSKPGSKSDSSFCRIDMGIKWKRFQAGVYQEVLAIEINKDSTAVYGRANEDWPEIRRTVQPVLKRNRGNLSKFGPFNNLQVPVSLQADGPPLLSCKVTNNQTLRCWGELITFFEKAASSLNFTFVYSYNNEGIGEHQSVDGWNGIMQQIQDGDVTFGLGAFGFTQFRQKFVQFSEPFLPAMISMLYRQSKPTLSIWQFLDPLSWKVWLSVFIVFIVISLVLYVQDLLDWTDASFPIRDSFYYTAGLLFQGSTDTAPETIPNRVLCACFMFFCLVVFQSYTANMAAFLTNRGEKDLRSLQALSVQSGIEYGVVQGSATMRVLNASTKDPYQTIWNFIIKNTTRRIFPNHETALKRVKRGRFVLITDSPFASHYANMSCDLQKVDDETSALRYALAMPLGAAYLGDINKVILRLRANDKVDAKVASSSKKTCRSQGSSSSGQKEPLSWEEMMGVFITLGIGAALSLVVAGMGYFLQKARPQKRNGNSNKNKEAKQDKV